MEATSPTDAVWSGRSDHAAHTALHALGWLVFANLVGLWLAVVLLWPEAGRLSGSLTYGRWTTVHLNVQLYGWCSLPFVGLLLRAYLPAEDRCGGSLALQAWSGALLFAAVSWLAGDVSSKPFVEWAGPARLVMPAAMLVLAAVLAAGYARRLRGGERDTRPLRAAKLILLAALPAVPFLLYSASDPASYPPINPDSGGATGGSLLGSSLGIVAVLLGYPWLARLPRARRDRWPAVAAVVFALHAAWFAVLDHGNRSHHEPGQILALGSLAIWVPLLVAYLRGFAWPRGSRVWLAAFAGWGCVLVFTALLTFLPGVLERWKFTHALVAHTHIAMAGLVTCLMVLVLLALDEKDRWREALLGGAPFAAWHLGLLLHALTLIALGAAESDRPTMLFYAEPASRAAFALRLAAGALMAWASLRWLTLAARAIRRPIPRSPSPGGPP